MSLEDSMAKTAVGGASKLLLAPVFLLFELTASLLPGMILAVLVALKRNQEFVRAFDHMPFGYKTKIAVGLVLCFVVGRVLGIPARLLEKRFMGRLQESMEKNPDAPAENLKHLAVGVFFLPSLFGKSEALTYMMLIRTDCYFSLSTGCALLIAAAVPGDGIFRLVELGAGLALAWVGCVGFKQAPKALVALFGMSLAGEIEKLVPGGLLGLVPIVLPLLMGKPGPSAPPTVSGATTPVLAKAQDGDKAAVPTLPSS
jgi:hypothetical protein